jgi:hypothetical protein
MNARRGRLLMWAPLVLIAFALFVFAGGEIVKLLWNALLPPLFGWPQVGFWQALGLLALCRILFGGFRLQGSGNRRTPEERERIRQRMREKFGFGPPAGAGPAERPVE